MDSKVYSVVGAAGEIFAIRRGLYQPAEPDSFIEDFVMSMRVAAGGHRVVYEPAATALEAGPASLADEFERRARIAAGGFQSIVRLRSLLLSGNPLLRFQYVSHRVLRWAVVPFLLPVLLLTNLLLARKRLYTGMLLGQGVLYGGAVVGWLAEANGLRPIRLVRVVFYFCLLNGAALTGFVRYVRGQQSVTWKPTRRLSMPQGAHVSDPT
jgi:cellulose synthase/poly-beta-1,6-N-acetylglucosamine synthase-like glycosyltransferase